LIEAWRLCRRPYADLTGEGARRFGGRWNRRGRPVVYLAEHPALAVLEVRVHLDIPLESLPDDYVLVRALLPDGPATTVAELPDDPIDVGDTWLIAAATAVLRVPSVLVPHAWNLLLDPTHAAARDACIVAVEPFRFDQRLWQPP
jgi:RES domain-containing protein